MTAAELSPHALVINSFSKYFCMTGWRVGWMVVPEALVRPIERLQQNLSISVPTLSQIAAEAAFDGHEEMEAIKRGYQENRRILIEGLPQAGLTKFLPADGAFYLYADVSDFTSDSFEFAKRMLEKAHVAATPGVDFDPIHGRPFIRFSYARSADEMREAVGASRAGSDRRATAAMPAFGVKPGVEKAGLVGIAPFLASSLIRIALGAALVQAIRRLLYRRGQSRGTGATPLTSARPMILAVCDGTPQARTRRNLDRE